jgi:putative flippase GtrA
MHQRVHRRDPESSEPLGSTEVMRDTATINARKRDRRAPASFANLKPDSGMLAHTARAINLDSDHALAGSDFDGLEDPKSGEMSEKNCESLIAPSTLVRWCKFNVVGGIGIIVQFVALFLLKGVLHFNYLAATAIAVEAAVVHNYAWHEQFTWADRVQPSWSDSLPRLLRFNLSNGAVSILGNLALMKVMVGPGRLNYLLANALAISLCSVANFLVSETWVFERE